VSGEEEKVVGKQAGIDQKRPKEEEVVNNF